jgi:hypothetical protein
MTRRLSDALVWTLVLVLIVLAMTGCARSGATSTSTLSTSAAAPAPEPTSTEPASTDPAVWAAVRFGQAQCSWDWRRPRLVYVAALQALATPSYGAQLASQVDPVAWQREVVAGRQQVSCTVSAPRRLLGAPSTAASVYVRMSVTEQVSSALGTFVGGDRIASWLVQRVAGRWLVAGTFSGG